MSNPGLLPNEGAWQKSFSSGCPLNQQPEKDTLPKRHLPWPTNESPKESPKPDVLDFTGSRPNVLCLGIGQPSPRSPKKKHNYFLFFKLNRVTTSSSFSSAQPIFRSSLLVHPFLTFLCLFPFPLFPPSSLRATLASFPSPSHEPRRSRDWPRVLRGTTAASRPQACRRGAEALRHSRG